MSTNEGEDLLDVLISLFWDHYSCLNHIGPQQAFCRLEWIEAEMKIAGNPDDVEAYENYKKTHYRMWLLSSMASWHPYIAAKTWCARRTGIGEEFIGDMIRIRFNADVGRTREDEESPLRSGCDPFEKNPDWRKDLRDLVKELRRLNLENWRETGWAKWHFEYRTSEFDSKNVNDYDCLSESEIQDLPPWSRARHEMPDSKMKQRVREEIPSWAITHLEQHDIEEGQSVIPPRLTDLHLRCLEALRRMKATELKPVPQREVAHILEDGATETYTKAPMGDLSNWGYVGGKRGTKGGNWLTQEGKARLTKDKKAGWKWD